MSAYVDNLKSFDIFQEEGWDSYWFEFAKSKSRAKLFFTIAKRTFNPTPRTPEEAVDFTRRLLLTLPSLDRLIEELPKLRDEFAAFQEEFFAELSSNDGRSNVDKSAVVGGMDSFH